MILRAVHRVACFVLRPPATTWPAKRGSWWARLRRWVLHVVFRHESESCDACGGRVGLAWCASDELWPIAYQAVTGVHRGGGGLLCPRCFERGARALGYRMWFRAEPMPGTKGSDP